MIQRSVFDQLVIEPPQDKYHNDARGYDSEVTNIILTCSLTLWSMIPVVTQV